MNQKVHIAPSLVTAACYITQEEVHFISIIGVIVIEENKVNLNKSLKDQIR